MLTTETVVLTVPEAAAARRSIRRFRQEPIDRDDLDLIFESVRLAPSAFNVQPWRFVVVTDPALKAELSAAANGQPQIASAPAVIVLYTDMAAVLEGLDDVMHPGVPTEKRAAQSHLSIRTVRSVILKGYELTTDKGRWSGDRPAGVDRASIKG